MTRSDLSIYAWLVGLEPMDLYLKWVGGSIVLLRKDVLAEALLSCICVKQSSTWSRTKNQGGGIFATSKSEIYRENYGESVENL